MVMPAPGPKPTSPNQNEQLSAEVKKLDRNIKALDASRQAVHKALTALGQTIDKRCQELVASATQKSRSLPGAQQANFCVVDARKALDHLVTQLDQLKNSYQRPFGQK